MSAHRRVAGRRGAAHRPGRAGASFAEASLCRAPFVAAGGFASDARAAQGIARLIRNKCREPDYAT